MTRVKYNKFEALSAKTNVSSTLQHQKFYEQFHWNLKESKEHKNNIERKMKLLLFMSCMP